MPDTWFWVATGILANLGSLALAGEALEVLNYPHRYRYRWVPPAAFIASVYTTAWIWSHV